MCRERRWAHQHPLQGEPPQCPEAPQGDKPPWFFPLTAFRYLAHFVTKSLPYPYQSGRFLITFINRRVFTLSSKLQWFSDAY